MSSRARGQCTKKMLTRLILLALLVAAGGLAWAEPIGAGDSDKSGAVGGCSGAICANRSGRAEGLEEPSGVDEEDEDDEGEEDEEDEGDGDGTAVEEGRGKGGGGGGGGGKKGKGYGKMLMMLAGLTKAAMLYIMIHAVAALAGKALIVAKVALAIATAVALKKSTEHKTSYEIVKHPQFSHVQTHSSSVDYDHGSSGSSGYEGSSRRRRRAFRR